MQQPVNKVVAMLPPADEKVLNLLALLFINQLINNAA